jgi:exocyst complex protein 7
MAGVAAQAAALAAARRGDVQQRRRTEGVDDTTAAAVRGAVGHMLRVLLDNLETKAKAYKNKVGVLLCCKASISLWCPRECRTPVLHEGWVTSRSGRDAQALSALFLMNNVHYIVKAVESSEALSVVGQDWIERHKDLIEQYGEEYQVGISNSNITEQRHRAPPCSAAANTAAFYGQHDSGSKH